MAGEKRPSVLMTADTVGGVWTYAVELARELSSRGVRVAIASMGAAVQPHQRAQLAGLDGVTLHQSEFRLEWMPEPWDDVAHAGEWLLSLDEQLRPDLIHLNQFSFGSLPFRAPTLLVAHSCVLSWWQAVHGVGAPADWDRYRDAVARGLEGASAVAAPTQAMLLTLASNYGFAGDGMVLPNARDPRLFAPGEKEPFVFAAGRFWDEAKNLAALQAVAPALPWPVRIAGSSTRFDGRPVTPQGVKVLGELAAVDVAHHMARASIYALPARYEPFGLSALEAALSGCALVLGDIASLSEVWGSAAVYVAPDDHTALQTAIERLIADPAERARLATAARHRALQFSPQRMVQAYLQAYATLQPAFTPAPLEELQCA